MVLLPYSLVVYFRPESVRALVRVFWQTNQLETDQIPLLVLTEEFLELLLGIHAGGLLENKPIAECVQMMSIRQLPHGFIVVVSVEVFDGYGAIEDVFNRVVVDDHFRVLSLELIKVRFRTKHLFCQQKLIYISLIV